MDLLALLKARGQVPMIGTSPRRVRHTIAPPPGTLRSDGSVRAPYDDVLPYSDLSTFLPQPVLASAAKFSFLDPEPGKFTLLVSSHYARALPENGVWVKPDPDEQGALSLYPTQADAIADENAFGVVLGPFFPGTYIIFKWSDSARTVGWLFVEGSAPSNMPGIVFAPFSQRNFTYDRSKDAVPGTRWEIDFLLAAEWVDEEYMRLIPKLTVGDQEVFSQEITLQGPVNIFEGLVRGKAVLEFLEEAPGLDIKHRVRTTLCLEGFDVDASPSDSQMFRCAHTQDVEFNKNEVLPHDLIGLTIDIGGYLSDPAEWALICARGTKTPAPEGA